MRILIVDDDYVSRTKLKALLSSYGDCDTAPSGKLAFEMFKAAYEEDLPYELITMDVDMPEERGQAIVKKIREWEAAEKIHLRGTEARILMVTVMSAAKEVVSSFRQGCEGYLVKPVTPDKLREALLQIGLAT